MHVGMTTKSFKCVWNNEKGVKATEIWQWLGLMIGNCICGEHPQKLFVGQDSQGDAL